MHCLLTASLLAGVVLGSAFSGTPSWSPTSTQPSWPATSASSCLSGPQATSIVTRFESLLTGPQAPSSNATASELLAENFTDTSDSIDSLAGYPVSYSCNDSSYTDINSLALSRSRRSRRSSLGKEHNPQFPTSRLWTSSSPAPRSAGVGSPTVSARMSQKSRVLISSR